MWCSLHYICLQETTEQVVQSGHKDSQGEFPMVIIDLACASHMIKIDGEQVSVMGLQKRDRKYIWSTALVPLIKGIHNPKAFSVSPAMGSLLPLNLHGFSLDDNLSLFSQETLQPWKAGAMS